MRSLFRVILMIGVFVVIGAIAGYITLRTIVKSEDVVIVPDLVGKDVVYALKLLTDLELNTKISSYEYGTAVPKDYVAAQEPGPGTEVKKGRDIRIVISKGPETVYVPDLRGLDIREASIVMADNGLVQGQVTEVHHAQMVLGEIGSQYPAPGSLVKRETSVDLLVGQGGFPLVFKMPKLEGLSLEDAVAEIQDYSLGMGTIHYVQKEGVPKDAIIAQDPSPGYPVVSGAQISLTVNRQPGVISHDRGLYFFHHPVDNGLLKTHVTLRLHVFGLTCDLVDGYLRPGEDIWMVVPHEQEAVLLLYQDDELMLTRSFSSSTDLTDGFEEWKWEIYGNRIGTSGDLLGQE